MSVYFRGMEIPKNCIDCYNKNIYHHVHMLVGCPYIEEAFHSFDFRKERHPDCHLTGVLPDCRLIAAPPKAYVDKEVFSMRLSELIKAFEPCPDKYDAAVCIKGVFDSFPEIIIPAEDSDHEER